MKDDFHSSPIQLRGRLNGAQRQRLLTLLDMEYTPSELAAAVGFTRRQIYRCYEKLGCPVKQDTRGRLWINGAKFRAWYHDTYPPIRVEPDQTFCLTCKKPVPMINPVLIEKKRIYILQSVCPNCERILAKFQSMP